jgi:dihydroorotate dehydrogenase (NAD+) catalytic subunit
MLKLAGALDAAGVDGIELNVSCPNVKKGGIIFGTDKKALAKLTAEVRMAVKHSILITKLSPTVSNITEFGLIAEENGSDAITLINTIPGMAIDTETWRPRLANITGGLSGPAIKPVAVKMVWEAFRAVKIPVIGVGGIMNVRDAIEFMLAGATAVQVGTGNFVRPTATAEIAEGLWTYLEKKGINNLKDIIGGVNGASTNSNSDN